MKKIYYITGAVGLAMVVAGIYSSQAQNINGSADEVVVIEEQNVLSTPAVNQSGNALKDVSSDTNSNSDGSFQPLPGDPGVEVEPAPENPPLSENGNTKTLDLN